MDVDDSDCLSCCLSAVAVLRRVRGADALPCRLWASHEEGENSEKIDTVDTIILIHSAI